jgi:hypothetical protein
MGCCITNQGDVGHSLIFQQTTEDKNLQNVFVKIKIHINEVFLLRMGNKIPMEGITETNFRAEMEGRAMQKLPHPEIHPTYNHQTQITIAYARKILLTGP